MIQERKLAILEWGIFLGLSVCAVVFCEAMGLKHNFGRTLLSTQSFYLQR
jgi:hypothetical protein